MELQEIINRSKAERHTYPDVFSADCGLDIIIPERRLHAVPTWGRRKGNPKRRATLNITTYRGLCADAIHYYGSIRIQGVHMEYDNEPGHATMDDEIENLLPLSGYSYELKLSRPVTQEDKDADKEARCEADIRFQWYNVGDMTDRFNSLKELIDFAKIVFKNRFVGNWEFYIESPFDKYNGKISI